jgi:hypothetical protein
MPLWSVGSDPGIRSQFRLAVFARSRITSPRPQPLPPPLEVHPICDWVDVMMRFDTHALESRVQPSDGRTPSHSDPTKADVREWPHLAYSVEKLEGPASGPVFRGHSTLAEVAIVDPGSI